MAVATTNGEMTEFIDRLLELNDEHENYWISECYLGQDYLLGLCEEAVGLFTKSYLTSKNKDLIKIAIDMFKTLKTIRLNTLSGKHFEDKVLDALC